MPKSTDTISQSDLAAAVAAHCLSNTLMWNLRQRFLNGANIEPGHYSIASGLPESTPPTEFNGFDQMGIAINIDRNVPELFT